MDVAQRPRVAEGVGRAAEALHLLHHQPGRPHRHVVALVRVDLARQDHLLEPVGVEALRQHRHLERGPAHVEPVDEAQHADAVGHVTSA